MDFSWFSTDIGTYVLYGAVGGAIGGLIGALVTHLFKSKLAGNLCVVLAIALALSVAFIHVHGVSVTVVLPAPAGAAHQQIKSAGYSVRELRQAPPMPEGSEVRLHGRLWQGEHGIIVEDDLCDDYCEDVLHFDGIAPKADKSVGTTFADLGDVLGCCNAKRAYFDMMVTIRYVDHVRPPGDDQTKSPHILAAVRMTKLISVTVDAQEHWLKTHKQ